MSLLPRHSLGAKSENGRFVIAPETGGLRGIDDHEFGAKITWLGAQGARS